MSRIIGQRLWAVSLLSVAVVGLAGACGDGAEGDAGVDPGVAAETAAADPEPVNGWIERALPDGVHLRREAGWATDAIEIPVPGNGGDLEYKLAMKAGDVLVYDIDYGDLAHPGDMISEFHGHTEKNAEGIGDLMFYANTAGADQSGALVAPFDGVHGWYLKNDGARDVVVKLNIAGYYELIGTGG